MGERARVDVHVQAQPRVELVASYAREVVALGVEEQLVEQRLGVVHARRLAGTLLLEQLDQGALFGAGGLRVGLDRVADVQRVLEQPQDLLVARVAHRAQQHRHRQLALAVDAHVHLALLVDLQLQPGPARGHQVGDEHLLLAVLRFHQVRARGAHQLGDHHALGAVDDERAALGHPREVAHEHRLLADLSRLAVDESHGHRQRTGVREVLLAALVERRDRLIERELAELDRKVARVVLDRRDVVDRLAQTAALRVGQPRERAALDVNQVGDVNGLVQAREASARPESICSSQEMTPSEGDTRAEEGAEARQRKIAQAIDALKGRRCSRTPPSTIAYVARRRTARTAAAIDQRRELYRKMRDCERKLKTVVVHGRWPRQPGQLDRDGTASSLDLSGSRDGGTATAENRLRRMRPPAQRRNRAAARESRGSHDSDGSAEHSNQNVPIVGGSCSRIPNVHRARIVRRS